MTEIKRLDELSSYDFPDKKWVPNGYDETQVPTATDRNFQILIDAHNQLVYAVNDLIDNDDEHTGDLKSLREDMRNF